MIQKTLELDVLLRKFKEGDALLFEDGEWNVVRLIETNLGYCYENLTDGKSPVEALRKYSDILEKVVDS